MTHGEAFRKPIGIKWFEWEGDQAALHNWIKFFKDNPDDHIRFDKGILEVKVAEGNFFSCPTNCIVIREIKGNYCPCDPKIFNLTYEVTQEYNG